MPIVHTEALTKIYGVASHPITALDEVDLAVEEGEFLAIMGPSGSGKSTLLYLLGGLDRPTSGTVWLRESDLSMLNDDALSRLRRTSLGFVFQFFNLVPVLSARENVALPLILDGVLRPDALRRADDALVRVGLADRGAHRPAELSGGEQQRVALARALVAEPALLLLDEPLSNLDAKLRESMRFEIKDVQRRLGITVIYVTHDQAEAMVMSDRIIVMDKGYVQQTGSPREIYETPANRFVADFIGLINFMEGSLVAMEGPDGVVALNDIPGPVHLKGRLHTSMKTGDRVVLAVRPEAITVLDQPAPGAVPGRLLRKIYLGNEMDYRVALGPLEVRATGPAASDGLAEGSPVWLSFSRVVVMPF